MGPATGLRCAQSLGGMGGHADQIDNDDVRNVSSRLNLMFKG